MADPNFLAEHGAGAPGATVLVPADTGFWKCTYDEEGRLLEVAHVRKPGGRSDGLHLYFDRANDTVTFKTPDGLSGTEWIDGRVYFGTVWDDDDGPGEGRAISLDEWVRECLARMVEG